jgi:hypothetical protein
MGKRTSRILPAAIAGTLGLGAACALAAEPTAQELQQQIQNLQARIQQLEQQPAPAAAESTVNSVLKDAESRSQLLDVPANEWTGYYRGEFGLGSADGNFLLKPSLLLQFRYIANYRDDAGDGDSDTESGFEVTRAKAGLSGHAFTPDLSYRIQFESSQDVNDSGEVTLEDAWIKHQCRPDLAFQIGQFRSIPFHEESVGDDRQLLVDRSMMNEILGGGTTDYVQGIAAIHDFNKQWMGKVALTDGMNSGNTSFEDSDDTEWGFEGRLEYRAFGDEMTYRDFSAMGNKEALLVLGGGFDWTDADAEVLTMAADVQYETNGGLALYGALVARTYDISSEGYFDYGPLIQAGYMMSPRCELVGRAALTVLDDDLVSGEDSFLELTAGTNYYLYGNSAKFSVDLTWLPDGAPDTGSDTFDYIGVLAGEDDQFVLRAQFQIAL